VFDSKTGVRSGGRGRQSLGESASLLALMTAAMVSHAVPVRAAVTCGTRNDVVDCATGPTYTNSGILNFTANVGVMVATGTSLSTLTNSGKIVQDVTAQSTGVLVRGSIGTLSNTGSITAENGISLSETGTIDTISNGGTIVASTSTGVLIEGHVGTLSNIGTISGSTAVNVGTIGTIGTFENAGQIISADYTAVIVDGTIGSLTNSGTISGSDSYAIDVSGKIGTLSNSGTISDVGGEYVLKIYGEIESLVNSELIVGGTSAAISNYHGLIGSLTNSGRISSTEGDTGIDNGSGTIGTLSNSGTISGGLSAGINNQNGSIGTLSNLGVIVASGVEGFDIVNTGNGVINTLINGQGGDGSGAAQTALSFSGNLPSTYLEHISSTTHYGQLWVTGAGTITISDFGIAEGSTLGRGSVTYDSVFTGVTTVEGQTGSVQGTFTSGSRSYDWDLVSSTVEGVWDLIITSLITAPTEEDTVGVNLSVGTQRFASQFDQSGVIKHITEIGNCAAGAKTDAAGVANVVKNLCLTGDSLATSTTANKTTVYAEVRGGTADITAHGLGNEDFSSHAAGVMVGVETQVDGMNATVGVFGSFSKVKSDSDTAKDTVDNVGIGAYFAKDLGAAFQLDGYAAYYRHSHDLSRDFGGTYTAQPNGTTLTGYARLSYSGLTQDKVTFKPYAALAYSKQSVDGYDEAGGDGALSVDGYSTSNVQSWVGANLAANMTMSNGLIVRPELDAALVHGTDDGEGLVTTTFVGEVDTYDAIISGQDQDYARIEASVSVEMSKDASLRIGYATELLNDDVKNMSEVRLEANLKF